MLSGIMLSGIMQGDVMLCCFMVRGILLSDLMLSGLMLNGLMVSGIMLSDVMWLSMRILLFGQMEVDHLLSMFSKINSINLTSSKIQPGANVIKLFCL